ncbi:MAG: hypothetical protein K2G37_06690 [Clostridia bacterium]|nr:hypothetical protein [Clostridia bacterium]MDE7329365.1 hypothetical protein [Clostridia bacterium]
MSIEKILNYQEVDMKLFKLENELKNSDSAKKMLFYQNATKTSYETLTRLNEAAEAAMENVKKNLSALEEINKQIEEIAGGDLPDLDEKQLDYFAKQLEKLEQRADELDKEINRLNRDLSDANAKYKKEYEQAGKSSKNYRVYSEEFNNLKKEKSVEAGSIMKELKDLEKDINPALMERYKKVKANKKRPVFVPFNKPCSCGGCGMEIASDIIDKLSVGLGIEECPNCGRLIYSKD